MYISKGYGQPGDTSHMNKHETINYVEFPSLDLDVTRAFFSDAFGWEFIDYGPDYTAISGAGLDGGFFKSDKTVDTDNGSALVVLYSNKLEDTRDKIVHAGGTIKKDIFSFPGGRRFHFCDPNGNEYAAWSDQ